MTPQLSMFQPLARTSDPMPSHIAAAEMKRCPRCEEFKAINEFSSRGKTRSGETLPGCYCKACRSARFKERMARPGVAEAERRKRFERFRLDPSALARNREHQRAYRNRKNSAESGFNRREHELRLANNKPGLKARWTVANRLRSGTISKPSNCERCGVAEPPRRIHAHHHDYSKPLEIEWLCSLCHGAEHSRFAGLVTNGETRRCAESGRPAQTWAAVR